MKPVDVDPLPRTQKEAGEPLVAVGESPATEEQARDESVPLRPRAARRNIRGVEFLQLKLAVLNSEMDMMIPSDLLEDVEFRKEVEALRTFHLEDYGRLHTAFTKSCADRAYLVHKSRRGVSGSYRKKPDPEKGHVLAKSTTSKGTVFLYAKDHDDLQVIWTKVKGVPDEFQKDIEQLVRNSRR